MLAKKTFIIDAR